MDRTSVSRFASEAAAFHAADVLARDGHLANLQNYVCGGQGLEDVAPLTMEPVVVSFSIV